MREYQPHISSTGCIAANILAALCYAAVLLLGFYGLVAAVVLFAVEKNSGFVKFHAAQAVALSILRGIASGVVTIVVAVVSGVLYGTASTLEMFDFDRVFLPFNLFSVSSSVISVVAQIVISISFFVFFVKAAISAYRWQEWKAPLVGELAFNISLKGTQPEYNGEGPVPPQAQQSQVPPPPFYGTGTPPPPSPGQTSAYQPTRGQQTSPPPQGYSPHGAPPPQAYQNPAPPFQGQPQNTSPGYNPASPPYAPYPYQPGQGPQTSGSSPHQGASPHGGPPTTQPKFRQPAAGVPKRDPNEQLPPEMRDPPPSHDMN